MTPIYEKAVSLARAVDQIEYGLQEPSVMTEHCHARIAQQLYVCADLVTFDAEPLVLVSFYHVPEDNDYGMYSETKVSELRVEDASEPFFMSRVDFGSLFAALLAEQHE